MLHDRPNTGEPEEVVALNDPGAGLQGFIVLHSTVRGPACGGTRFWTYPGHQSALFDAKRLAEGMSYKNALADLPMGGGKTVIMRPDADFDRARLFQAFGEAIEALDGRYVTAEDVGTTIEDMVNVASRTRHVSGKQHSPDRPSGDPSPWTARGVFRSMEVAVRRKLGGSLAEVTVAVQGVGNVGMRLCEMLHEAGARLTVSDPRSDATQAAARRFGARIVEGIDILAADCNVFAPCALGGTLDRHSIPKLKAQLVCGGANNQLHSPEDGERLCERGILYAPDYVVNAGGVINVAAEYLDWSNEEVATRVDAIGRRLAEVLDLADRDGIASNRAADRMARELVYREPAGCPAEQVQ